MKTLRQDALEKVFKGITSVQEMVRAINEEDEDVQH
jgi:general secretion pathway protein E